MSLNFGFIQKSGTSSGNFLPLTGGTMDGDINMDDNKITNVGPAVINTTYTRDEYTDDITVDGTVSGGVIGDALSTSDIKSMKDVEINVSMRTTDLAPGFFIYGHALSVFGKFNNLSGYVKEASITVVQPTASNRASTLTSVQLKMTSEDTPKIVSTNLSQKLTRSLSPGTYSLTPLTTKFTNLKFLVFFFEGGDQIITTDFSARIVLSILV